MALSDAERHRIQDVCVYAAKSGQAMGCLGETDGWTRKDEWRGMVDYMNCVSLDLEKKEDWSLREGKRRTTRSRYRVCACLYDTVCMWVDVRSM